MPPRRLQLSELRALRAEAQYQAEQENIYSYRRALEAAKVLVALDELLERRLRDVRVEALARPEDGSLSERDAINKLLDACASNPTEHACGAMQVLRSAGWRAEAELSDGGITIRFFVPKP